MADTAASAASNFLISRTAIVLTDADPDALMILVTAAFALVVAAADADTASIFVIAALTDVVAVAEPLNAMFFVTLACEDTVAVALTAIARFFVRLAEAFVICAAAAARAASGLFTDATALTVPTPFRDAARFDVLLRSADVEAKPVADAN